MGVGIAGAGSVADIHAEALHQLESTKLVAVYSRNAENAKRLASKFGAEFTTDWDEFLANPEIKLVSVCTPSGAHLEYGAPAAAAGKHVVVEKPIEVTLEKARELIDTCLHYKVHLSVIFQNRFIPDVQQMKRVISEGGIGKIHLADAYIKWFRDQEYYDTGGWRGSLALDGGGALINQSVHTIDLLQWMVGEVEEIYGYTGTFTHERIEGEDTGIALLRFHNGSIGVIEGATSVFPAQERRLEIHGDQGTAVLQGNKFTLLTGKPADQEEQKEEEGVGAASPFAGFSVEPHKNQFADIVEAIQSGGDSSVSGEEALKSLGIVLGIYESSSTHKPVQLQEFMYQKIR